jgi:hypothetical protein
MFSLYVPLYVLSYLCILSSLKKHFLLGFKICQKQHVVILNLVCVHAHVSSQLAPNIANK